MNPRLSGGVFALLEGAVAQLVQELRVMGQRPDMAPVDVIRLDPDVVRAELGQAPQHRVDLQLSGDEGVERRVTPAPWPCFDPLSVLHRAPSPAPAVAPPMLGSAALSSRF